MDKLCVITQAYIRNAGPKKPVTMTHETDKLLKSLAQLPADWHESGTLVLEVLQAIAKHCSRENKLSHTIETGSGSSTLLFSNLSNDHLVFTIGGATSLEKVRKSELLNREVVTFIEGPSQQTLPRYNFHQEFDAALIDGPHGYPFPDLEYYYIYPRLKPGAVLIVDDINITSIRNMYKVIKADDMFMLLEVVGTTAFFQRTEAATFNPFGDGWWEQGYNRREYERILAARKPSFRRSLKRLAKKFASRVLPTA
jgi:predicted O-methyltransferase YrrM